MLKGDPGGKSSEGESGTWITTAMQRAFNRLHQLGHAHAVEVWRDKQLLGGIYGLALGKVFFGESMFSRETDASKIALIALCRQLEAWQFALLDCQVPNPHLQSLGAVTLPRAEVRGAGKGNTHELAKAGGPLNGGDYLGKDGQSRTLRVAAVAAKFGTSQAGL